ncbi:hypothetical protein C8F04DRAFT_1270011 [Mycena alexandri]|uniref:Uncharacterized protein n=1 Tax=Mycena alexandri TaxID=1745969 RepID=A0AAD6WTG8_9AGAR|nr:hypothetical protein C8F04DRAFT_1270011 [Mycena alexandri]
MARTKQTAGKSTGGAAPKKALAPLPQVSSPPEVTPRPQRKKRKAAEDPPVDAIVLTLPVTTAPQQPPTSCAPNNRLYYLWTPTL